MKTPSVLWGRFGYLTELHNIMIVTLVTVDYSISWAFLARFSNPVDRLYTTSVD